ncbi:beta-1,6-N-acetylglucosaminyltransferase [Streptococcus infantarius]|uniref:beta-1,6-N-acetylglucosaminyltransferase n=1 Tax=Streptococcus infantarius TaxID=102684 RepID=UPI0022DF3521|nr:beta-1,6-N-acetylglucosaminyltransferase [Streptococcus infantarius]
MVHKDMYSFEKLLQLLDYELNDIDVHVDLKCKNFNYDLYKSLINKSKLIFIEDRYSVIWGGVSQIDAELSLLKTARQNGNYSYYHLMSGSDLPLESPRKIHQFFNENDGKIYLDIHPIDNPKNEFERKIYRRIFTQSRSISGNKAKFLVLLDRLYLMWQDKILRRDYIRQKGIRLAYGSNWFSLPKYIVDYILANKGKITDYFSQGCFVDELFIQTLLREGGHSVERSNLRYIDFRRSDRPGHPYVWRAKDYEELINVKELFARKFDADIDKEIINKIVKHVELAD